MPKINGFELSKKLIDKDKNVKVCFITAYELYYDSLKKDYPTLDVGCFIQKPTAIDELVKHVCTKNFVYLFALELDRPGNIAIVIFINNRCKLELKN